MWIEEQACPRCSLNKSEFIEVRCQGKPIKQRIQHNETTKVPGPDQTAEDDQRVIIK
jgi:hypothetical protein